MANIFAFAEGRNGELRKVALETVTAARKLADATGGEVHALLVGAPGIAAKAEQLGQHGADVVIVCEHVGFTQYNPEATSALAAERLKAEAQRSAEFDPGLPAVMPVTINALPPAETHAATPASVEPSPPPTPTTSPAAWPSASRWPAPW